MPWDDLGPWAVLALFNDHDCYVLPTCAGDMTRDHTETLIQYFQVSGRNFDIPFTDDAGLDNMD